MVRSCVVFLFTFFRLVERKNLITYKGCLRIRFPSVGHFFVVLVRCHLPTSLHLLLISSQGASLFPAMCHLYLTVNRTDTVTLPVFRPEVQIIDLYSFVLMDSSRLSISLLHG